MARRKHRFYCPDPEEHFTGVRRNRRNPFFEPVPAKSYPPAPDASRVLPAWFMPLASFGTLTDVGRKIARYSSDIFGFIRVGYDPVEKELSVYAEKKAGDLYADLMAAGYRVAAVDRFKKRFVIYPPVPTPTAKPDVEATPVNGDDNDREQYEGLGYLFDN